MRYMQAKRVCYEDETPKGRLGNTRRRRRRRLAARVETVEETEKEVGGALLGRLVVGLLLLVEEVAVSKGVGRATPLEASCMLAEDRTVARRSRLDCSTWQVISRGKVILARQAHRHGLLARLTRTLADGDDDDDVVAVVAPPARCWACLKGYFHATVLYLLQPNTIAAHANSRPGESDQGT